MRSVLLKLAAIAMLGLSLPALAADETGATPGQETAGKFVAFVASPDGQKIIGSYGRDRFGEALYNDETYARQYELTSSRRSA